MRGYGMHRRPTLENSAIVPSPGARCATRNPRKPERLGNRGPSARSLPRSAVFTQVRRGHLRELAVSLAQGARYDAGRCVVCAAISSASRDFGTRRFVSPIVMPYQL